MRLTLIFVALLALYHQANASQANWSQHGVATDVVDTPPAEELHVFYRDTNQHVQHGNVLTPTQVRNTPELRWNAEKDAYYTLLMVDPDAPSRQDPQMGQWRHWLVGNIKDNDVAGGDSLTAYVGSGPPPETGLHRYVFLLYKQPGRVTFDEPIVTNTSAATRPRFSAKTFAEKYNLGAPVAGNFYRAEYDDYVPILYRQLGN